MSRTPDGLCRSRSVPGSARPVARPRGAAVHARRRRPGAPAAPAGPTGCPFSGVRRSCDGEALRAGTARAMRDTACSSPASVQVRCPGSSRAASRASFRRRLPVTHTTDWVTTSNLNFRLSVSWCADSGWGSGVGPDLRLSSMYRNCRGLSIFGSRSAAAVVLLPPAGLPPRNRSMCLTVISCLYIGCTIGHDSVLERRATFESKEETPDFYRWNRT